MSEEPGTANRIGTRLERLFEAGRWLVLSGEPGIAGQTAQMIDNLVGREEEETLLEEGMQVLEFRSETVIRQTI